ncbi:hypothetical protein EMGBD1_14720 [Anaerolineaceae bacterium]|nr:hypothetical protein EMGBD1_14720 [Anaerolineaceae bacterium]
MDLKVRERPDLTVFFQACIIPVQNKRLNKNSLNNKVLETIRI